MVQPRKTCSDITEKLLIGTYRPKSNKQVEPVLSIGYEKKALVYSYMVYIVNHKGCVVMYVNKMYTRNVLKFQTRVGCQKMPRQPVRKQSDQGLHCLLF